MDLFDLRTSEVEQNFEFKNLKKAEFEKSKGTSFYVHHGKDIICIDGSKGEWTTQQILKSGEDISDFV